jgi:hypothetical protein
MLHIGVLWTRIEANADPDPAFYLKKGDKDPDPGSQTNADPDLDRLSHKNLKPRIETNADPDPAFYQKKGDTDSGPDPGSATNADPDPRQT